MSSCTATAGPARWAAMTDHELSAVAAQWTRMGASFGAAPATAPVDLEQLIVTTAHATPDDERLFVVAASWLAMHHAFVNGRRLAVMASRLSRGFRPVNGDPADREQSAVLGAMLAWAADLAGGALSLKAATLRCRPLSPQQPLFRVTALFPSVATRIRACALPRFAAWGIWHTNDTPKFNAVRPVGWLLDHAPELRLRAIAGPTLEADVLAAVLLGLPGALPTARRAVPGVTVRDIAQGLGVSYAATRESAGKLVGRGLLTREHLGARQVLRTTRAGAAWLD